MAAGVLSYGAFVIITEEHLHRTPVEYPYLRVIAKPYPWKDGRTGLFEKPEHGHGKH